MSQERSALNLDLELQDVAGIKKVKPCSIREAHPIQPSTVKLTVLTACDDLCAVVLQLSIITEMMFMHCQHLLAGRITWSQGPC